MDCTRRPEVAKCQCWFTKYGFTRHEDGLRISHNRGRVPHPTRTFTSLADPRDTQIIDDPQDDPMIK